MRLLAFIISLLNPVAWFKWISATEPVLEPVPVKSSANSTASAADIRDNAIGTTATEPVPEPAPKLNPRPPPAVQAHALLEWLHARHAGDGLTSAYVATECYPAMLREHGWQAQPWDSRDGVGKHLTRLLGGRRHSGYLTQADGTKRRCRAYFIPRVIEVKKRA